ncbi:MAG: DUF3376 domain-containing protein [Ignavibacteriales bacterium]|nr:DUF3376 domain-containing protein [Ignavibacteriales bacterium]
MSNYEKELRIGLVLYGGVSLCMYIFGVVYEFLRLVRKDGAYKQLTDEAKIKPIIDVISGTSAGGINGIFLAKALATGASLDSLKSLWIEEGDLDKLIDMGKNPVSLLDSNNYMKKLENALNGVKLSPDDQKNFQPEFELLDLFITATDLDGVFQTFEGNYFNSPVTVKSYETVFQFKIRPERYEKVIGIEDKLLNENRTGRNDFSGENEYQKNKYLARVAATTSAFPVAFAPVKYTVEDKKRMKEIFQESVCKGDGTKNTVYGDGGMVNNRPFNYTVQTIFNRQADTIVDRKLFFVEPDPETVKFALEEKDGTLKRVADKEEADGFDSLKGLFEAGLYQSIASDLKNVFERNNKIVEVKKVLRDMEAELIIFISNNSNNIREGIISNPIHNSYTNFKVKSLCSKIENNLVQKIIDKKIEAEIKSLVKNKLNDLAKDKYEFLQTFDYPFRIRRLRYFISMINRWVRENEDIEKTTVEKLSELKLKLYNFVEFYNHQAWRINNFIPIITKENCNDVINDYTEKFKKIMSDEFKEQSRKIIVELQDYLAINKLNEKFGIKILLNDIFNAFEFLDMHIFPMIILSDIGEADPIEIIRISPDLATHYSNGDNLISDKLAGEMLMHFSAFLKKSWRENDILQGRLDAAELIVRTILNEPENQKTAESIIDNLCKGIVETELKEIINRRKCEITNSAINQDDLNKIKTILDERCGLDIKATEEYFKTNYKVGLENLKDIPQNYVVVLGAKVLRTFGFLVQRIPGKATPLISKMLNKPAQIVSKVNSYIYYMVLALKGELKSLTQNILLFVSLFILVLLTLNIFGMVKIQTPFIWGAVGLLFVFIITNSKWIRVISSAAYIGFVFLHYYNRGSFDAIISFFN